MSGMKKLQGEAFVSEARRRLGALEDHNLYSGSYARPRFSKEDLEGEIVIACEDGRISEHERDILLQELQEAQC